MAQAARTASSRSAHEWIVRRSVTLPPSAVSTVMRCASVSALRLSASVMCCFTSIDLFEGETAIRLLTPLTPESSRNLAGLRRAKMQRVSQALQLPVVVEGRRSLVRKLQTLQELDFLRGRGAAERGILKEFLEPQLLAD